MDGAHIIDVNALLISIASTNIEKKAKFPLIMKMGRAPFDEVYDVYKPSVFSIGPYHHKSEATKEMEQLKWESLQYILRVNPEKKMRDYLEAMAELEQQIRSCYASDIEIGSDEFIKMMLLDGCFILCTLYWTEGTSQLVSNVNESGMDERNLNSEPHIKDSVTVTGACGSQQNSGNYMYHDNSPDSIYYSKHRYTALTTIDLVILENQIPFFVVVKLFEVVTNGNIPIATLLEIVARFLKDLLLSYPAANFKIDQQEELHHLHHLSHLYFKPNEIQMKSNSSINTYNDKESPSVKVVGWHRAVEYFNAGIVVKKQETSSENAHYLLDIAFNDGVMEIPCLTIEPNTYCLFRNLIAFEETCPQFGNYMTAYVVFLSQFITTPEDVSLLTKRGIIVDQLDGDAEIFDLFRMLALGVPFDFNGEYYLKHICHDMEVHYQMQRPRWRDWLGSIGSKLPDWAHESKPNQFPRR